MSKLYGRENLMGLGCNLSSGSIDYVIAVKNGKIAGADFEIDLPDVWTEVCGKTERLNLIYEDMSIAI